MHITDAKFGDEIKYDLAYEVLRKTKKKLDTVSTQLLLMEEYDIAYGIHDHDKRYKGLEIPLLSLHAAEDSGIDSPLYESMSGFATSGIFKRFGINLIEFLNLPRDYCEEITKVARSLEEEEAKINKAAYDELKAQKEAQANQNQLKLF